MFELFFDSPQNFIFLIPLLPLAGFLINALAGKRLPEGAVSIIGCAGPFASLILSVGMVITLAGGSYPDGLSQSVYNWINIKGFSVDAAFRIDQLTAVMLFVVTGVGSLIHIYSAGYMHGDGSFSRYFAYLNLFMFAMLILILADNLLFMFVGWEGVGLCSYLLIGFWFEDTAKAKAGKKAFLVNRIGDFGFIIAILLIFTTLGTLSFVELEGQLVRYIGIGGSLGILTVIGLLLFLGATGKSAQIPLYVWLPDAMAGPTPVSALIHAATMVTAGVYMIGRMWFLFAGAPGVLPLIATVGAVTAFFAATIGLQQYDIKKVLAYSTVSQLGYMFLAMGVMAFSAGIFHLVTHAFFKGLLFLGAGSVIHSMSGEQDIRKMGGLAKRIPITFITFMVATVAISGIPPFAGFFSKDEILWKTFEQFRLTSNPTYLILWVLGIVTALLTAFYMFRLAALTFFGKERMSAEASGHIHESPLSMTFVLMVLAVLSVIGGLIGVPELLGGHNIIHHYLGNVFKATPGSLSHHVAVPLEKMNMVISIGGCLLVSIAAFVLYSKYYSALEKFREKNPAARFFHKLLYNKYYVDEIYSAFIVKPLRFTADLLYLLVDMIIIDGSINLAGHITRFTGYILRTVQSGLVRDYVLYLACSAILIVYFLILRLL